MLFANKIKELREKKQMVQRQIAAAIEIDTPMHSKVELRERLSKRNQITIAQFLQANENELVNLLIADKILSAIGDEKELAPEVFKAALQKINQK